METRVVVPDLLMIDLWLPPEAQRPGSARKVSGLVRSAIWEGLVEP